MQLLLVMQGEEVAKLEIAVQTVVLPPGVSIGTMVPILVVGTVKNLLPDLALARAAVAVAPAIWEVTPGECLLYNGPITNATAVPAAAAGAMKPMARTILPPPAAPQQAAMAKL